MKYIVEWQDDKRNKGSFNNVEASSKEEAITKVKGYMTTDTIVKYIAYEKSK